MDEVDLGQGISTLTFQSQSTVSDRTRRPTHSGWTETVQARALSEPTMSMLSGMTCHAALIYLSGCNVTEGRSMQARSALDPERSKRWQAKENHRGGRPLGCHPTRQLPREVKSWPRE